MTGTRKFAVAAVLMGIAGGAVIAQQAGFTRFPLQDQLLSDPAR